MTLRVFFVCTALTVLSSHAIAMEAADLSTAKTNMKEAAACTGCTSLQEAREESCGTCWRRLCRGKRLTDDDGRPVGLSLESYLEYLGKAKSPGEFVRRIRDRLDEFPTLAENFASLDGIFDRVIKQVGRYMLSHGEAEENFDSAPFAAVLLAASADSL